MFLNIADSLMNFHIECIDVLFEVQVSVDVSFR